MRAEQHLQEKLQDWTEISSPHFGLHERDFDTWLRVQHLTFMAKIVDHMDDIRASILRIESNAERGKG